jgi:putative ABC transport system permease protein
MIRNYLKTAFRNLLKNKGFTAINVLGLALGLATCLLIVFYVFDELSYDKYNVNADRIYRINNDIKFGGNEGSYAVDPAPTAAAVKADFAEIEQVTRLKRDRKISRKTPWFMPIRPYLMYLPCLWSAAILKPP